MATQLQEDFSEANRWRGRTERIVARILGDVAVATVLYGLWLLYMIAYRG